MTDAGIRIIPRTEQGELSGFFLKGRRPDNVLEWAHATLAMAHFAITSEVFSYTEPVFLALHDDPIRLIDDTLIDIPVVETGIPDVDGISFGAFALGGAIMRVDKDIAVAALLFPGAPQLGIGHSASVVHTDAEGVVHRMITDDNASLGIDPDLAVLSSLLLEERLA